MSAAQTLARWREAEQGATEGPWESRHERNEDGDWVGADIVHTYRNERVRWPNQVLATADLSPEDAEFIATSREAMPALLAAIEDILALCDKADARPIDGLRKVHTASIRQVAERHLTTASTPTTGEGMDKPLAVTGSGWTANTGGLDSPGVGTSTTQGERA